MELRKDLFILGDIYLAKGDVSQIFALFPLLLKDLMGYNLKGSVTVVSCCSDGWSLSGSSLVSFFRSIPILFISNCFSFEQWLDLFRFNRINFYWFDVIFGVLCNKSVERWSCLKTCLSKQDAVEKYILPKTSVVH